jgi:hypothetical protein
MTNLLVKAAERLQKLLEQAGQPFCFIGGVTVQRWGEPRVTRDVDACLYTGFMRDEAVISLLLKHYDGRRPDAADFARVARVLLLLDRKSRSGIDVSLGAVDFEFRAIERSSLAPYGRKIELRTCSAEDLIVYKAFAARELDWHDIKGVLIRQEGRLDFELIERELKPLVELKEEPEIWERWRKLRARYER